MKVRIIADGTLNGTRVYDAETGKEIGNVRRVVFEHEVGRPPQVSLALTSRGGECLRISTEELWADVGT